MRVAIDAHTIGLRMTGNEVYVRNLMAQFSILDQDADFTAYVSRPEAEAWVPAKFVRQRVSANPWLRLGWDLRRELRSSRPDLVHVQYTAPLGCPARVVVTVHDVSFVEQPEYFPAWRRCQLRLTVRRTVRQAVRVITGSEFSRGAIARAYGLPEEQICVIPNAAGPEFRPIGREGAARRVRDRFEIQAPFLLTVGDLQPRKNQIGLITAFEEVLRAAPELPHRLVIAGKETWFGPRVKNVAARSRASGRVHFTGFVTDQELVDLYNACDAFVFPSLYEGFGLPVLEAMACGRAVACSNRSAIPEVADSAAILFDPASTDSMARAMLDLLRHGELRARMERLGLRRAAQFSWRKTAEQTLEVYREVAGEKRAPVRRRAAVVAP